MKSRTFAAVITFATIIALLAPATSHAGRRPSLYRRPGPGRVEYRLSDGGVLAALAGLVILGAIINEVAEPQHTCGYVTRQEWIPGRYEPRVESRWVRTRQGGYYQTVTVQEWIPGYYRTVTVRAPYCCR